MYDKILQRRLFAPPAGHPCPASSDKNRPSILRQNSPARKFDEAVKSLPKGKARAVQLPRVYVLQQAGFELEQSLSDLSPQERYLQRLETGKPVLTLFGVGKYPYSGRRSLPWESPYVPEGAVAVPGELFAGWPAEISNNRAERSIKALL